MIEGGRYCLLMFTLFKIIYDLWLLFITIFMIEFMFHQIGVLLMYVVTLLQWSSTSKTYEEMNKICAKMRLGYVFQNTT